jgi:single-strand DNA-binding protein
LPSRAVGRAAATARRRPTGFNVKAWGRLGEISQQYLKKGSLVYVEGRLRTDKYEDKGGETKYFTKVVALTLQFLDRKPAEEPVEEMGVEEEPANYDA